MLIGYTSGVFDLFHIGHLNILKNAKRMCDKLVVGVSVDDWVLEYKGKKPLIPFADRLEIVKSIRYVDAVIPQENMDKLTICQTVGAEIMFMGDDKRNDPEWVEIKRVLGLHGIKTVFFPYTKDISTTLISEAFDDDRSVLAKIKNAGYKLNGGCK